MKHIDIPATLRITRREYNGRPYVSFAILYSGKEYAVSFSRARTQLRRALQEYIDINALRGEDDET